MKKTLGKILAIALSISTVVSIAPAVSSFAEETSGQVTTEKTASWVSGQEGKEVEIVIDQSKNKGLSSTPKILFLGTLCGAHGLDPTYKTGDSTTSDLSTVYKSLEATAKFGDVDYRLYQTSTALSAYSGTPYTGKVTMDSTYNQIKTNLTNSGATTMRTGYHSATYDFAEFLKTVTLGEAGEGKIHYDYIVLEFDGMRMGHYGVGGDNDQKADLNAAAEVLKEYYAQDKIAWIVPEYSKHNETVYPYDYTNNKSQTSSSKTAYSKYMYNDIFLDNDVAGIKNNSSEYLYRVNVRETIKLLAPEDLVNGEVPTTKVFDASGNFTSTFKTLGERLNTRSGEGIWVFYNNADDVFNFLQKRLSNANIEVTDVVRSGLTIKDNGVTGWYKEIGSDNKPTGDWKKITSADAFSYTKTSVTDGTKVVGTFNLNKIYGDTYLPSAADNVRMIISCTVDQQDSSKSDYLFKAPDYSIETNVGDAIIDSILGSSVIENKEESPKLSLKPLEIEKTASATATQGGTIDYTIKVSNDTGEKVTSVVVKDNLPSGISSITDKTGSTNVTFDSKDNIWTITELADGSSQTISFTASVPADAATGSYTNTAKITKYNSKDIPDGAQPTATASTTVKKSKPTVTMEADKTAAWTEDGKKLDIKISEHTSAVSTDTPKILFLGTLCDQHGMDDMNVVYDALESATKYGEVDYHLFKRKYNSQTVSEKKGNFAKGKTKAEIMTEISSCSLKKGYHSSLYDFAAILKDVDVDSYDYVIMEFDGMRLGHFEIENYPTATDVANLNQAAANMKELYAAGKVAWIIPDIATKTIKTTSKGVTSEISNLDVIYNDYFFDNEDDYFTTAKTYVRETLKLLAPEDLVDGEVSGTLTEQKTLISRTSESDDQIWVYYNNAARVRIFLDEKLGNHITVSDVVVPGLTVTGIKGQYKKTGETSWTDIPAASTVEITDDESAAEGKMLSYTKSTDTDGKTTIKADFNLSEIYSSYIYGNANDVQLVISCEVDTSKSTTIYKYDDKNNIYELETNDGDAQIENNGGGTVIKNEEPTPDVDNTPVTVSYRYVGDVVPYDTANSKDKQPPASAKMPKYNLYKAADKDTAAGFVFDGWYLDDKLTQAYPADGKEIDKDTTLYGKWSVVANIEKTATDELYAGDKISYSIKVENNTSDALTNVVVKDALPSVITTINYTAEDGVTYSSTDKTWTITSLAAKSSRTINFTADVPANTAKGTYTNTATITGYNDLTIEEKNQPQSTADTEVKEPVNVTYQFVNAPDGVSDMLPESDRIEKDSSYNAASTTGIEKFGYIFEGWYNQEACTNKYSDGTQITGNKTLFGIWTPALSVEKTATESVIRGSTIRYDIKVTNNTDAEVKKVVVVDTLPDGMTAAQYTVQDGISYDMLTKTFTIESIPAGGSVTIENYRSAAPMDIDAGKSLTNTATITGYDSKSLDAADQPTDTADTTILESIKVSYQFVNAPAGVSSMLPKERYAEKGAGYTADSTSKIHEHGYTFKGWYNDEACTNKYSDGTVLNADKVLYGIWAPALTIDKKATEDVFPGETITYNIEVENNTEDTLVNVVVMDTLPGIITDISYTTEAGVTYISKDKTWTIGSIEKGKSKTITFTATVPADTDAGTYTNKAEVTHYNDEKIVYAQDRPTDTADTRVKEPITVTYHFVNAPEGVSDKLPAVETIEKNTAYNSADKTNIKKHGYIFKGWYNEEACTSAYTDGTTLTESDNLYGIWTPAFTIDKTATAEVFPGESISYEVKVENKTDAAMANVVVSDVLPSGITEVTYTSEDGVTYSSKDKTWTITSLAANSSRTIKFTAKAPATLAAGTYTNTAKITSYDDKSLDEKDQPEDTANTKVKDPVEVIYHFVGDKPDGADKMLPKTAKIEKNEEYNSADKTDIKEHGYIFKGWYNEEGCTTSYTDGTKITGEKNLYGIWSRAVTIDKTATADVFPGESISYEVKVENKTDAAMSNVVVSDVLPSGITEVTYTTENGVNYDKDKLTWTITSLAANSSKTIKFTAKAPTTLAAGTYTNTAKVTGYDSKEIAEKNQPKDTANTKVKAPVEVIYHFVGDKPDGADKMLPKTDKIEKNTTYDSADKTDIKKHGYIFKGWYNEEGCTTSYTDGTTLTGEKHLYGIWSRAVTIKKTATDKVLPGGTITYTVEVKNNTDADMANVVVKDTMPSGLTDYADTTASDQGITADAGNATAGTKIWTITSLAKGATKTISYTAKAPKTAKTTDSYTNSARVTKYDGKDIDEKDQPKDEKTTGIKDFITVKYQYKSEGKPDGVDTLLPADETIEKNTEYSSADKSRIVKHGYIFSGWYSNPDCTTNYTEKSKLEENTTLYGKWEPALTVKKTATKEVMPGSTVDYTIKVTNNTDSEVTEVVVNDTMPDALTDFSYTEKDNVKYSSLTKAWTIPSIAAKGSYTISFTAKAPTADKTSVGAEYENVARITKYDDKALDEKDQPEDKANTKIKRFVQVQYEYQGTVPNGATKPADEVLEYGVSYTAKEKSTTTITDTKHYSFKGWCTDESLNNKFTSGDLKEESFASLKDNPVIKLYGKWIENNYDVDKDVFYGKDKSGKDASIKDSWTNAGCTVTYKITIKNKNTTEDSEISFVDKLPAGLTIIENSINGDGTYSSAKGEISWKDITVKAGESITVSFNATVPADITAVTEYKNKTYITEANGDTSYNGPGSENKDPGEANFDGVPVKTLAVTKSWSDTWDDHSSVTVGLYKNSETTAIVTYTLTKTDNYKSTTLEAFEDEDEDGDYEAISYSFKEIIEGKPVADDSIKTITVKSKDAKYMVDYVGDGDDKDSVETTTINNIYQIQPEDLDFNKTAEEKAEASETGSDKTFTYTITVKNTREHETAKDVEVVDIIPAGLTVVSSDKIDADSLVKTEQETTKRDVYTWTIKEIAPGATATLKLVVKVPEGANAEEYKNKATITKIGGTSCDPKDSPETSTIVRSFEASKSWTDREGKAIAYADTEKKPTVKLTLYQNGKVYGDTDTKPVELTYANKWKYKWTKLPMYDDKNAPYIYTVGEASTEGYKVPTMLYDSSDKSKANGNFSVDITNQEKTMNVVYKFVGDVVPKDVKVPDSEKKDYGTNYKVGTAPSTPGYVFTGWCTDEACEKAYPTDGIKLNDKNIVNDTLTIYGKWIKIERKIHYEPNGGTGEPGDDTINYFDPANISKIKPTKAGLTFLGWSTDPNASKPDPDFDPEALVKKANSEEGLADLTVYAVWGVKVSYQYVGDVPSLVKLPDSEDLEKGVKYTAASKPTRLGYTFAGWHTDPQCTIAYVDGTEINENTILYGKWTKNASVILATGDSNMLLYSLATMLASILAAVLIIRRRKIS